MTFSKSLIHLTMLVTFVTRNCSQLFVRASARPDSLPKLYRESAKKPGAPHPNEARKKFKTVQVHVIHRHGDRTPITPLKNETFWQSALPKSEILSKIAENTKLIREEGKEDKHIAKGRGPFGQLSQLGLLQMVQLGSKLREELNVDDLDDHHIDEDGHVHLHKGRLFTPDVPLDPKRIKVVSTDFPRTIHSVQGLLVGLFPEGDIDHIHEIDVRHTSILIPDPQPRQSKEQEELEKLLAARPHLQEREKKMKELAVKTTQALQHALADDAHDISFGIGEEKGEISAETKLKPLPWTQLAEITKCLQVRDLLPPDITQEDQEAFASHAAWKWFENLRHPRLSYLAMNKMVTQIVDNMDRKQSDGTQEDDHLLHIYSGHDSTLIGLLCAFRLEQPTKWPEYGSYLKIELIEATDVEAPESVQGDHFVRFSLNGEVLRCYWGDRGDEPVEMIRLDDLLRLSSMPHEGLQP